MEKVRMKPVSVKHRKTRTNPSKNRANPPMSQPQELIPKRFFVGLPFDPNTQKLMETRGEMEAKFGKSSASYVFPKVCQSEQNYYTEIPEARIVEYDSSGSNMEYPIPSGRENLRDREDNSCGDKLRNKPKIEVFSDYPTIFDGHTKRKCAWATPPDSAPTTSRIDKSDDEDMPSSANEKNPTVDNHNISSETEDASEENSSTVSETSISTSATTDDDSDDSSTSENFPIIKEPNMTAEIQKSSGDHLGWKSDKVENADSTNKNKSKDEQPIERIQIAEDYDEILKFFSATNLSDMERRLSPDDPLVMNKFYRISKMLGGPDWNLDRDAIMDNLAEFVKLPVAVGFLVKCKIYRDRRGIDGGMFPTYVMQLENEHCKNTHLMSARKRKKTAKANYLISIDPLKLVRTGESIVGNVRGNVLGTQFTIYDGGDSPKKCLIGCGLTPREELGAIIYQQDILQLKGPRKMQFLLPAMVNESKRFERYPDGDHDTILASNKNGIQHGLLDLRNKPPLFNDHAQSFVLDFHGRVSVASIKNFQVIHPDNAGYTILQFGRVSEDVFNLDFRYPLCPLQAFGIILSCFTSKLASD